MICRFCKNSGYFRFNLCGEHYEEYERELDTLVGTISHLPEVSSWDGWKRKEV